VRLAAAITAFADAAASSADAVALVASTYAVSIMGARNTRVLTIKIGISTCDFETKDS
jgi:hypothetical protein